MFGNNLIIRKDFTYNEDEYCLNQRMLELSRDKSFLYDFKNLYGDLRLQTEEYMPPYAFLINPRSLVDNMYHHDTFYIAIEGHKALTIPTGIKLMKAISKIVNEFGNNSLKEKFEEFRITHSEIIGTRQVTDTICLSIHPLDFLTISDTPYFSSCTSWRPRMYNGKLKIGSSRAGTIEMMNSPMVVIAYIEGKKKLTFPSFKNPEEKLEWNGKRWRELFIVHPYLISNIRAYPYDNEPLEREIILWLRELAQTNLNWGYYDELGNNINNFKEEYFATNIMYNDIIRPDRTCTYAVGFTRPKDKFLLNYSGECTCASCGRSRTCSLPEDYMLLCDDCAGREDFWADD